MRLLYLLVVCSRGRFLTTCPELSQRGGEGGLLCAFTMPWFENRSSTALATHLAHLVELKLWREYICSHLVSIIVVCCRIVFHFSLFLSLTVNKSDGCGGGAAATAAYCASFCRCQNVRTDSSPGALQWFFSELVLVFGCHPLTRVIALQNDEFEREIRSLRKDRKRFANAWV